MDVELTGPCTAAGMPGLGTHEGLLCCSQGPFAEQGPALEFTDLPTAGPWTSHPTMKRPLPASPGRAQLDREWAELAGCSATPLPAPRLVPLGGAQPV